MKQLLNGTILDMLVVPKGVITAVLSEITNDGKMLVEYKMISLDTYEEHKISNKIYLLAKFGADHKTIELQVRNHLTCKACVLPDSSVLIIEDDGGAKLLDNDLCVKWRGNIKYRDECPSGAAFDGENFWISFNENNTIVKLDCNSMREELRIGSKNGKNGFAGPCGVFCDNGDLFVANSKSNQVWKINTKTYAAEEYMSFGEPVMAYAKTFNSEIVWLKSGIYEI